MSNSVEIARIPIGLDHPPCLVAEIGINHSGSLDDALEMIRLAKMAGAAMVKFQKRTPRLCVPRSEWDNPRETPWGTMPYIEYKEHLEFGKEEYDAIDALCLELDLPWFASVWDLASVDFISQYNPPALKIGSASLTDTKLVEKVATSGRPIILSTGMSTNGEIYEAVNSLSRAWPRLILCHSTSIYPCPKKQLNLRYIQKLQELWPDIVIGYSGHERDMRVTPQAVALGASYIERHFTLDRFGWGTDQAASLEDWQFRELAIYLAEGWQSLGDGVKVVYPEEEKKKASLRQK